MFRKKNNARPPQTAPAPAPVARITSVLGSGINWKGQIAGSGGVRIEGTFEGEITLRGLLVIGETGRVTCPHVRAHMVVVAGIVQGDITAEKVEIRRTGRVYGNVVSVAFATEEGAFLRGQIRMEEHIDLGIGEAEAHPLSEVPPRENTTEV